MSIELDSNDQVTVENFHRAWQFFRSRGLLLDRVEQLEAEVGYPRVDETLPADVYLSAYLNDPVAARVVNIYPLESWQQFPIIEDEAGYDSLFSQSIREHPYVRDVRPYLMQADQACGIGRFAVIYLLTDDDQDPSMPLGLGSQLIGLRIFYEPFVTITWSSYQREPLYYQLTLRDVDAAKTLRVHPSRVVHIMDDFHQIPISAYYGVPRLRPVWRRILDIRRVLAAFSEGYYRAAIPSVLITTDPRNPRIQVDPEQLKEQLFMFFQGIQRYLAVRNLQVQFVPTSVIDPNPYIQLCLDLIAVAIGVPKRVFLGSERGELASTQDDSIWNDRLKLRRTSFITPKIVNKFIDHCLQYELLPEPKGMYRVSWPELALINAQQRVDMIQKQVATLAQYFQAQLHAIVPIDRMLSVIFDKPMEEIQTWLSEIRRDVGEGDINTTEQESNAEGISTESQT